MQKKLIVLAILSLASTAAMADVGVYGVLDGAIANVSGTGVKGALLGVSGGLAASRLGVKATEKLDNGMTGVAVMEFGIDGQTNAGTSGGTVTAGANSGNARQELLGVAGGFGTVATGYLQTAGFDFGVSYDPFADSSVSALQNVTGASFLLGSTGFAARAQRAVAYISPKIGDLSFAVNYSTALFGLGDAATASASANTNITAYLGTATYATGPLSVNLTYIGTGGQDNATEFGVGASYDLAVAKLFATYQSNTSNTVGGATSVSTKAYSVSAVAPAGPGALVLGYAANSGAAATANGYSVAYLHPMSKTTTAYAAYTGVTNSGNTAGTNGYSVDNGVYGSALATGASSSLAAVGLSKKF